MSRTENHNSLMFEKSSAEQSLSELERVFGQLPGIAVQGCTADRRVVFWNAFSESLYGYSAQEAVGRRIEELIVPQAARADVVVSMKKWFEYGHSTALETFDFCHRDGHVVPVFLQQIVTRCADEPLLLILHINLSHLHHLKVQYQTLIDTMPLNVAVYQAIDDGEDFVFIDFNAAAEVTEKVSKQEVLGKRVTTVFPGIKPFGLLDAFKRVYRSGKPEHFDVKLYQDDRITGWRSNDLYRLPDSSVVAIYQDVTYQKQLEEEREHAYQRERALRQVLEVSSSIQKLFHRGCSVGEKLQRCCELIVEIPTLRLAWIGLLADGSLHLASQQGLCHTGLSPQELKQAFVEKVDVGKRIERQIQAGAQMVQIDDIANDQSLEPWFELQCKPNLTSYVSIPLYDAQKCELIGQLSLYTDAEHGFIQEELLILRDLAEIIAKTILLDQQMMHKEQVLSELFQSRQLLRNVIDNVPARIFWKDRDSVYMGGNRLFLQDAGFENEDQLIGRSDFDCPWIETADAYRHDDRQVMQSRQSLIQYEEQQTDAAGVCRWVATSKTPLIDQRDQVMGVLGIYQDITEQKQAQAAIAERDSIIRKQALYDHLTDLPNRLLLEDRLQQAIKQAKRLGSKVGVFFLDLDNFKAINDTLGHAYGDQLLTDVGHRLSKLLRSSDTVARIGGDEFIVLLPNVQTMETFRGLAQKILLQLRIPFVVGHSEFFTSVSIGGSLFPDTTCDEERLLGQADAAMYEAKQKGRDQVQIFDQNIHARVTREQCILNALNKKIMDEFHLLFQPQVDVHTGRIVGAEALLRWQSSELGAVSPAEFIPLAEQSRKILHLGEWVIRQALNALQQWQQQGIYIKLAINLSARQFEHYAIDQFLLPALKQSGIDPQWLEVEITESLAMSNIEQNIEQLDRLRQQGVSIALDDFGTGYSSLGYLSQLPLDVLKVDRTFTGRMVKNNKDARLVKSIAQISETYGLQLVLEGVETLEQQAFARELGHCHGQGYLYSKPLSAQQFIAYFHTQSSSVPDSGC